MKHFIQNSTNRSANALVTILAELIDTNTAKIGVACVYEFG